MFYSTSMKVAGTFLLAMLAVQAQQPRFGERVDVARVMVDVRVLDDQGNSVEGLDAGDFIVRIDGRPARVESALWTRHAIPESDDRRADLQSTTLTAGSAAPGGLVVFLFQKSLESSRIVGLMRLLIDTTAILDTVRTSDRVAVLSFDSHLNIWTDFTTDRECLRPIFKRGVLLERPPRVEPSPGVSLLATLSADEARRTYSIEKSLELIGRALQPLPGVKSVVLVGYGFGRLGPIGVSMENAYGPAVRALLAARASIFSLDITRADYHSLEAGLQLVADETGGFYLSTYRVPSSFALKQLAGVLAGAYTLFVEKPKGGSSAWHDLDVKLRGRKGTVHAPAGYVE